MTLEQRLQYFSKIFKRSNDLQETVAKAFGKSARDAQGNVIAVEGLHDAHQPFVEREPYTTDALQKNIEYSVDALIPPAPPAPAGPAVVSISDGEVTYNVCRFPSFDNVHEQYGGTLPEGWTYAYCFFFQGGGVSYFSTATPSVGDVIYSYSGSYVTTAFTASSVALGSCISANINEVGPMACLSHSGSSEAGYAGEWSATVDGTEFIFYTVSATPSVNDTIFSKSQGVLAECGSVVAYSNIVAGASTFSDDESAVTPVDNVVFADVKRFCNGDDSGLSTWFKKEVSSQLPTVTFSCTHGSVVATVDGKEIGSGVHVGYGKSVVFTITADEGYQYTGTNPETVVVSGDVTKAYECTLIPVVVSPAVISFSNSSVSFLGARASSKDDPAAHPTWDHAYGWQVPGLGILYTSSDTPDTSASVYLYEGEWIEMSAISIASVAIGKCISAHLKTPSSDLPDYFPLTPGTGDGNWNASISSIAFVLHSASPDPTVGDELTITSPAAYSAYKYEVALKSNIVAGASIFSDDESAVTPVDNVVFADVKRFCNGDDSGLSTWFKKEVSSQLPTVTFSCTHGSVVATVDGKEIGSGVHVGYGKSVVFTITADEGYQYTGTNPETVVVSGDVTKAYECTLIPVVVSPAVISIVNETEYNIPRSFNFDELAPTPLPEDWTHAYAWYGGDYIYYTSSSSPSTTDHLWDYDEGWIDVTAEYSIAITSVAIGPCVSGYIDDEEDWYDALTPSTDSPKAGFEGEWTDGYGNGFYTVSATPSVDDIIYDNQETPQPAGVVAAYSNISE